MGLDLTGIIAGALGGGAQAAQSMAQSDIAQQQKQDLFDHEQGALASRAQALKDYEVNSANAQREARAERLRTGTAGILDAQMNTRLNNYSANLNKQDNGGRRTDVTMDERTPEELAQVQPSASDIDQAQRQSLINSADADGNHVLSTSATLQRAELSNDRAKYGADQRLAGTKYGADSRLEGTQDTNDTKDGIADKRIAARGTPEAAQTKLDAQADRALFDRASKEIDKLRENLVMSKADRDAALTLAIRNRDTAAARLSDRSNRTPAAPTMTPPTSFGAPAAGAAPSSRTLKPFAAAQASGITLD